MPNLYNISEPPFYYLQMRIIKSTLVVLIQRLDKHYPPFIECFEITAYCFHLIPIVPWGLEWEN